MWKNPVYRAKHIESSIRNLRASYQHPSNPEIRVAALIWNHGLPYDFVGDFQLLIGGKCPDFVHRSLKVVVEVADEHDKIHRGGWESKEIYERARRRHFSYYGYSCIFLWSEMNDEEIVGLLK